MSGLENYFQLVDRCWLTDQLTNWQTNQSTK